MEFDKLEINTSQADSSALSVAMPVMAAASAASKIEGAVDRGERGCGAVV